MVTKVNSLKQPSKMPSMGHVIVHRHGALSSALAMALFSVNGRRVALILVTGCRGHAEVGPA